MRWIIVLKQHEGFFPKGVGLVDILSAVRPRRATLYILGFSNVVMVSMYCSLVSFGSKLWKRPGELNKKTQNSAQNNTQSVFNMQNNFRVYFLGFRKLCYLIAWHGACNTWKYSDTEFSLIRLFFYYQILKTISSRNKWSVQASWLVFCHCPSIDFFFFLIFDPYKVKDGPPLFYVSLVL